MHPQQEKYQQKKILYERKKNRKKNSNPNIKNLFSNQKIKNQQNENNNNNKQQPKKFFLNINEEKPQLTTKKKTLFAIALVTVIAFDVLAIYDNVPIRMYKEYLSDDNLALEESKFFQENYNSIDTISIQKNTDN